MRINATKVQLYMNIFIFNQRINQDLLFKYIDSLCTFEKHPSETEFLKKCKFFLISGNSTGAEHIDSLNNFMQI